jgi:glutathione S-transferase
MEPILFYGVPQGSSFGVIVALEWLGQPYKLCRIQMPEVATTDAFKRINPLAETPSLLTASGEAMSESMAILLHATARAPDASVSAPHGTPEYDRINSALAFLNTTFYGAFAPLWYLYEHETQGKARDALTAYGHGAVAKAHAHLELALAGREWMAGGHRSIADAYFMGIARWLDYHGVFDRQKYPRVHGLHQRLIDDPAVQLAWAIEDERPLPAGTVFAGHVSLEEALSRMRA